MIQDDELLQEFVVESAEHLADVEGQLLEIEGQGEDLNIDLVNTVFRAVHSVKGAAGFLGLSTINELAHNLENVLNQVRNQELVPTHQVVDALLRSADKLRTLVDDVGGSNEVDVSAQVAELKRIHEGETEAAIAEDLECVAESVNDSLENPKDSVVPASAGEDSAEGSQPAAQQEPESSVPAVDASAETAPGPEAGSQPAASQNTAQPAKAKPAPAASSRPNTPKPNTPKPSAAKKDAKQSAKQPESNVRVNVSVLDRLMNLAGELVLSRNQLLQAVNNSSRDQLEDIASRLDHVTSELQEAIMATRMQPVGTVFNRFPRVVRDLSGKLGKKCSLEIEGSDVELDKTIIEAIGDPLTHLVRNSVDHGVENPDVRLANGKPEQGVIRLRAFHQAGKVCIRIEDNGGGIDPEKLKSKAISNGILTESDAEKLSNVDALRLIFAPGFSTAAAVTDVSGRGVGMDVVRTNIEQIGGSVEVESELGVGSAMHITLPLTLAIIPSMIVGSGSEKYAIPQTNIAELVRVPSTEIDRRIGCVQGAEVLRLRGALLPLVRLGTTLDAKPADEQATHRGLNVIVVESGQLRYGIVVDKLYDSEEIVVKPLGRQLKDASYLAGATILGDGYVALILDITGLAAIAKLRSGDEAGVLAEDEGQELNEKHRLLLFGNASEEHFAIPMACISRIERTRVDEILDLGGKSLLPYRGGTLPLLCVEEQITAKPRDSELDHVFIVVFTVAGREIGLITPVLRDICNIALEVDAGSLREPGVAGVIVVGDTPTRLLDVVEMTKNAHPEWIEKEDNEPEPDGKHILVAEDSSFFRRHVEQTLVDDGYTVTTAIDGQEAWEKLQAMDPLPYAVVTDVEMPNMNGLEFCEHIRADARTVELPVVALTSLASDDDVARGQAAGVNDYQTKMDRDSLLRSLASFSKV